MGLLMLMAKESLTLIKEAVRVDSRGRLVLGDRFKEKQFSIRVNSDGEILLTPVVVMPAKEAWLLKNKAGLSAESNKNHPQNKDSSKTLDSLFKPKTSR